MGAFNDGIRITLRLLEPSISCRNISKPTQAATDTEFLWSNDDTYRIKDVCL